MKPQALRDAGARIQEAYQRLWSAGVVHGDVARRNVCLGAAREGRVTIPDLGLARPASERAVAQEAAAVVTGDATAQRTEERGRLVGEQKSAAERGPVSGAPYTVGGVDFMWIKAGSFVMGRWLGRGFERWGSLLIPTVLE